MSKTEALDKLTGLEVAVIGMVCRFPGANSIDEFWQNLRNGVESLSFFSDEDIVASGTNPALLDHPNYVKAGTVIDGVELFDAPFFGFTPREAEITDPQQRLFLESAWQALENSGYDPETFEGRIGLFAGVSMSSYLMNCFSAINGQDGFGHQAMLIGNDKDFLPTRVSYKLNLTGPSVNVQSACSTSLVAVHLAVQSLLGGECEMALAGGVSIRLPQKTGYLCTDGFVLSHDGHCRAFDAGADGCVGSSGLGIVVLKRLEDALASGDHIRAVIKGSAINNDGSSKIGYTAPGIAGQTRVIRAAQVMAEVEPETISYIEAHGTATPLGDPIEVAALTQAFRAKTQRKGFCAIGSVKTNIGHTDAAAGVAGLIKTALSLEHHMIPPSLNFEKPNPQIAFDDSPFYVANKLAEWQRNETPRRAGVSSFGLGGTNAHVVLEEAPAALESGDSREWQLFLLSSKTRSALETATLNLETHLRRRPELKLADVAYTLQVGRRHFKHRRMILCRDHDGALQALESCKVAGAIPICEAAEGRPVIFMFPGGGTQYVNMGSGLYKTEPAFRQQVDACCEILEPHLGYDLRSLLYPPPEQSAKAEEQLGREAILPSVFVTEYALAKLWISWGIRPQAMIGHSLGEYVAACLAGVFSLEDALSTTVMRTKLLHRLSDIAMLIVMSGEAEVRSLMVEGLSLAAINGPSQCLVAGPVSAISRMQDSLGERGVEHRRLRASSASHCEAVTPVLGEFLDHLKGLKLNAPSLPYVSNVTGTWIKAEEATDPNYWARHLRHTVRLADGIKELSQDPARVLLEVGPGNTLSRLAKSQADHMHVQPLSSLRHARDEQPDAAFTINTLGKLWASGVQVDWARFYANERRRRVPLPLYPFERQRYWIEPRKLNYEADGAAFEPGADASADRPDHQLTVAARAESFDGATTAKYPRPPLPTLYVAPQNRTQEQVADIWQRFFKIEPIGVDDNFFDLGGDSLLAIQLISRLREAFRVEVPVRSFFEARTVALMSEVVDKLTRDGRTSTVPPLVPARRDSPLPLSFAQQRLWFLNQLEPENSFYNQAMAFRVTGSLDRSALQQALNEIVKRHEVLRTSFVLVGSQPAQVIIPDLKIELEVIDLRQLSSDARDEEAARMGITHAQRPFNLSQAPLLLALLFRLGEEDQIVVMVMHHIISDGWSLKILINEIEALYEAYSDGKGSPLPELPIQYADYACWQREWLQGDALEEQLNYWKSQLTGAPAALELPTDRPRPRTQSYRGATQFIQIPTDVVEDLKRLSKQENASLFMTMLAAFSTLLYRYSGQPDIVIGSPIANRTRAEIEGLIGFFVNTLALRTDLTGEPNFRELVRRVRGMTLGAYEHQDLPFEKLVEELQPVRDLSRSPVFQVMFSVESVALPAPQVPGLDFSVADSVIPVSKFDITLTINEHPDAMDGWLSYSTDLFDAESMERLLGSFQCLLAAAVNNPESPVWALPILTERQKEQVVEQWNQTAQDYDERLCVHELFERRARANGEQVAVIYDGQQMSYAELDRRANQLANYLRSRAVGPDVSVGVCMQRGIELVIGLLAILKAGAAYVPLDPSYPTDRLSYMVEDAGVKLILTQQKLMGIVSGCAAKRVVIEKQRRKIEKQSGSKPDSGVSSENLVYVIYTSGSTGKPKGVMIDHRGINNCLAWMQSTYQLEHTDRFLMRTSLNFDPSVWELFWTLSVGACAVILPQEKDADIDYLIKLMAEQKVTTAYFVPSMLAAFLEGRVGECRWLKRVISGGEKLPVGTMNQFFRLLSGELHHSYGPTEASIATSEWVCERDHKGPVPIGRPIGNTQIYLLDEHLQPVPVGVPGHLYIGGVGLARGYQNQPQVTAEKFVPNPFSAQPDARLYDTGDLARYLADGKIEFLGRVDHQVKVRGFRIELAEIEEALKSHDKIKEAIATTYEYSAGEKVIVAYIVPDQGESPTTTSLRQYLKERLPGYMLPSAYVLLDELPLTVSGKVDRSMLPEPDGARPLLEKPYIAPRTRLEQMLAEMWRAALGIEEVGIYDNFFELGGSSIKAAIFINELQARLGEYVYIMALFDAANIFELAEYLAKHYPEAAERACESEGGERVVLSHAVNIANQSELLNTQADGRVSETRCDTVADSQSISALGSGPPVIGMGNQSSQVLLGIRSGDSKHPLILIPPMGGNVFGYRELAHHLSPRQAIYGMQPRGLDGSEEPFDSVEGEVQCYVEALRALQPEGPYFLAGASYGGIVAFEMAQRLCAQEQKVALLAMIDTPAPGDSIEKPEEAAAMLASFLSAVIGDEISVSAEYMRQLEPDELIRYCFEELKAANKLPTNNGFFEAEAILRVCQSNARAMLNYVPRSYSGRITYFRAEDRIEGQPQYPELPWIGLADGGIEIHRVPGNHYTILTAPHVKILAERLKHCLEQIFYSIEKPAGYFQMAYSAGGAVMQSAPGENRS